MSDKPALAAEIDRLRAEVAALKAELEETRTNLKLEALHQINQIDAWTINVVRNRAGAALARIDALLGEAPPASRRPEPVVKP